ncbi:excinuclease ABC subunit C [Candidatus Falkowbacteria bacterium RIFOXYC2_FULL_47_12]|uniref:UvrABC system protein C n=2 Tax=Candidatus Falkowiibacteriota TaxID=1752728 RepID=A0A1F5TNH3_9BACT|nr:MAG: excinuclease ABC subunit C [Candidatus Falkowbacteria bacterium RIFOXYA2_FULL_47_9]OGF40061.1 MAG: excinuclease ABC subunit C [Candidatus Falkowbacteria bacterium RIFOXYC2_FULL_47_12]
MPILKEKIKNIVDKPGVYQFKDKSGNLLYIGKAKSLKKRVSSYFNKKTKEQENKKTSELVKKIKDIEVITTKNEVEAFLLEASLIRQNQPPYNIDLKSSSGRYAYLKITDEKFPRVIVARTAKDLKSGRLFGPYTSAQTRREAQYWANSILKLRTCKRLPKQACLLYHINLCSAPCINNISEQDYAANIKLAEKFLRGEVKELQEFLRADMKRLSSEQKYEQAKTRRDQILALEHLREKQNVDLPKGYDQDVINYVITPREMVVQMFNIVKGLVSGRKEFRFDLTLARIATRSVASGPNPSPYQGEGEGGEVSEFLRRYYENNEIPEEIILPRELADGEALAEYLSKVSGRKIIITVPQKGAKKELLNLLQQNLEISARVGNAVLMELQQALNLPAVPRVMEMFDISHTGGKEIVASMVQFTDGQPNKSGYRKFKIRTVKDNDDFASMREVVRRRYERLSSKDAIKERSRTPLKGVRLLPDLIIVDGGRGQLSSALGVLQELGINVPLIALAKKNEEIYTVGKRFPVRLSKTSEALKLVQRIRDEAHRFAINFHRQRREKAFIKNAK